MWPEPDTQRRRDRDGSDALMSQETHAATRNWKRKGTESPLEHSEEPHPCRRLTWEFWPPGGERFLLF